jgi:hypothetical protein
MGTASRKGYAGERPIEEYLQWRYGRGYRPRAGQPHDVGDIGGVPLVVSAKNHARLSLSTWVDEMSEMVVSANLETGVVWHKRKGKASPSAWYVTTTGALFEPMLDLWMERRG